MFLLPFIVGVALGGLLNVIIYRLPRLWPVPDAASQPDEPFTPADAVSSPVVMAQGGPPPVPTDATSQAAVQGGQRFAPTDAEHLPVNASDINQHPAPSIQHPALRCTRSGEPLGWADSVPLLGWVGQRGRCRHCGKRLPLSFPLVELGTGLAIAAAWIDYGLGPLFFIYSFFTLILIITLTIDWQHHDLYSIVLLAGAGLALLGAIFSPEVDLSSALIGGAVGGGTLLFFYFIARLIYGGESDALAFGDVELAVMLGLMLGYPGILGPLLLGPLIAGLIGLGLVFVRVKRLHDYIPVGASFCFAAICALLLRDQLWRTLPLDNLTYWLGVLGDDIRNWLGSFISSR